MFADIITAMVGFVVEWQAFAYLAILAAFVVIGICFILGGEFREKAKTSIPYVIIGAIIVMGAVQLADALYGSLQF